MLDYEDEARYLGLTVQSRLNWRPHIEDACSRTRRTLFALNSAVGKKWGFSPKVAHWVYTSMARPCVLYASFVWAFNVNIHIRNLLNRLQRLALTLISPVVRSTPTKGMEILLNIMPLVLFAEKEALKMRLRLRSEVEETCALHMAPGLKTKLDLVLL